MKFLIFGKNGQVGSALGRLLHKHDVIAFDKDELDLAEQSAIEEVIKQHEPDWVINASAYTAVDPAEENEALADAINHLAPAAMAKVCAQLGCPMVHYSTDYVFNGEAKQPYKEDDLTCPQSAYGRTKLAGEQAVMQHQPNSIILRTAWVYAAQGANFVNTMLRLGQERDQLNVVDDQFGSPTLAQDLAQATVQIIEQTPSRQFGEKAGIYHATGSGHTTWYQFAKKVFELTGNDRIELNPIPSSAYPTPAKRPAFSVLSNEKLKTAFDLEMPEWQTALAQTLQQKT